MQIFNQSSNSFTELPLHISEGKVGALSNKKTSERAELIKFWVDNVLDKKGNKYKPAFIAMKMSGYSIKDLYYLQSQARDYVNRVKDATVGKYFWSLFK